MHPHPPRLAFAPEPIATGARLDHEAPPMPPPLCTRLLIVHDDKRLQPWAGGIRLLAKGRSGGLTAEPDLLCRPLLDDDVLGTVLVHGNAVAVVVPQGMGWRRRERCVRHLARLVELLSPEVVVLAANEVWRTAKFSERLAPAISAHADALISGRSRMDLGTANGRGRWSLVVAVMSGPEAGPEIGAGWAGGSISASDGLAA